ncbi:MAG TPA: efflux RND transporter periplasmic adaptor subunit, partial [Paracoccaceae bacterium]|nr:efflux RND transporter periplasmic adaptor subunit [Paracoccaceae bacterium]
ASSGNLMRPTPLLTALLIAAGLYYWFELRHEPAGEVMAASAEAAPAVSDSTEAPVQVVVLHSEAEETRGELILRGRTVADRSVEVAAETTGRVVSPSIRRGAVVEAGQVLCELDSGTRAAELAEAEAALAEAEVLASGAAQLAAKGFASETELKQRQAQLRAAQARLDRVKADIEKLKIHAPFKGVLETDTAVLGTLLAPGAICAEVVDLDPITVQAFVSEVEVGQLAVGQSAAVRLVNGMTAEGEVSFVSRTGDEATRTFAVEVTIPNPDRAIRAGLTAEVSVALPPKTAHLLPQSALTLDDDGRLGVRVAEDGTARFHAVSILRETPEGVWIDGLPPRADVIVIGQEFVRDGARIAAVPASAGMLE